MKKKGRKKSGLVALHIGVKFEDDKHTDRVPFLYWGREGSAILSLFLER